MRDGIDAFVEQFVECGEVRGSRRIAVARARCSGSGSTMPTSVTPGRPASTRAWLLPITPAPTTPTRKRALCIGCCASDTDRSGTRRLIDPGTDVRRLDDLRR